jgi:hypothetical protein
MKTILALSAIVAAIVATLVAIGLGFVAIVGMLDVVEPQLQLPLRYVKAYEVDCVDTGTGTSLVVPNGTGSLFVWVNSATPVYIGGADVDDSHGMPLCTATADCPASSLSLDVREARCLSSSGTVTATVIAGVI